MKRGDYAALLLFLVQAALAFWHATGLATVVPSLGDFYFHVPLHPLSEALSSVRTLGYPLFHAFVAGMGHGLPAYPEAQMLILIPCVFVLWLGLRAYGLSGLAALAAASPALWMVPVEQVIPETLAKCFAIASIGFMLWAAGRRGAVAYIGLAFSLFAACQMRPAFLFLVVFIPFAWFFLYARHWGLRHQTRALRQSLYVATACVLPLFLFCLFRLAVVGHFGLVSFGGQNTIGIAVEMLDADTVSRLPVEDRPLAQLLARGREAWPAPRYLNTRGVQGNWFDAARTYVANINRTARNILSRFPDGNMAAGNVSQDKALSRLSTRTFVLEWRTYGAWLSDAAVESIRVAVHLLLGGGGSDGFGYGARAPLAALLALLGLAAASWPLEQRAFGDGSRPHFSRAATVVFFVTGAFFLYKMLLVILVEPPIPRYVEAAAFLLPCAVAALFWDRAVVLAAGLSRRPWWYGECYVACPPVPDMPQPLPWREWLPRRLPGRRIVAAAAVAALLLLTATWWGTRDNRFFRALEREPEAALDTLRGEHPPVTWRARDGATPLHFAALHNDRALIEHLLERGANSAAAALDGATALHWAALGKADGAAVEALLDAGLAADAAGPLGMTPVHLAALFGNLPALEALIARGGDVGAATPYGVTPLHVADSAAVAGVLLDHGAAIEARDLAQATPLVWAHNRELAAFLLERGADVNTKENWRSFIRGGTPLAKAAYQGDADSARWLLERGADPNAGDISNLSPIYYAIWQRNYPLMQLLLDKGADPNHPGRWAAYSREAFSDRFTDIFLKTTGQHIKRDSFARFVPDEAIMRPLDWAAFRGDVAALEILLSRGADMALHNDQGMSALHWALLGRWSNAVQWLRRADPGAALLDDTRRPLKAFEAAVRATN